jgi:hypothetical protein
MVQAIEVAMKAVAAKRVLICIVMDYVSLKNIKLRTVEEGDEQNQLNDSCVTSSLPSFDQLLLILFLRMLPAVNIISGLKTLKYPKTMNESFRNNRCRERQFQFAEEPDREKRLGFL